MRICDPSNPPPVHTLFLQTQLRLHQKVLVNVEQSSTNVNVHNSLHNTIPKRSEQPFAFWSPEVSEIRTFAALNNSNMRKMSWLLRLTMICAVLFSYQAVDAQGIMKGWEVGPWGGVSYYFGDLNTNYRLNRPNAAGGIMARYNFNDRLAFSLSGNFGTVEAYDSDSENPFEFNRNLSFESRIWDGTALIDFNFLPYIHGSRDYFFTPYLFGGISVFNFNPRAVYDGDVPISSNTGEVEPGELVDLRPLGTEGQFKGEEYFLTAVALTGGIGFKFDINYDWSVNIHVGVRSTGTDYLDDVSTTYPDESDLLSTGGPLAVYMSSGRSLEVAGGTPVPLEGRQRGDDTHRDNYLFAGVGVLYYFGDLRCPNYGKGTRRSK